MRVLSGKCLCGQVRISVRNEPLRVGICHCTDCRKESGSAFTFYGVWPVQQFEYVGETSEFNAQHFCPRCGSRLFSADDREAEIKLGILSEAPTPLTPSYELWVKRRETWLRPIKGAEQYEENRKKSNLGLWFHMIASQRTHEIFMAMVMLLRYAENQSNAIRAEEGAGFMAARKYAVIEAPSNLGLRPAGVELLPEALLRHDLEKRLNARHAARLKVPAYDATRDPATLTLNAQSIARWSPQLADAVGEVFDRGEFPIVLGGDCSIVLGPTLALKRRGRYGLFFIDGHADFYQPEANPNGEAASMDLAFATGHGPALLADIEGRGPLVREEDVFVFGFRDEEEQREYGSQPLPPSLRAYDLAKVRELGVDAAATAAVAHLTRPELQGFFIHVDADCLNDDVMPAVEYRLPNGLTLDELRRTLEIALASGKAMGIEVTVYNPNLDEGGEAGRRLAHLLADVLGTGMATRSATSTPAAGAR